MIAQYTGSNDYLYPGYAAAVVADNPDSKLPSEWDIWPYLGVPEQAPLVGNSQHRITKATIADGSAVMTVCVYGYSVARKSAEENFVSISQKAQQAGRPNPGISVQLVKLRQPTDQRDPIAPQVGPDSAPSQDVFHGWKIVGTLTEWAAGDPNFDLEWPTTPLTSRCVWTERRIRSPNEAINRRRASSGRLPDPNTHAWVACRVAKTTHIVQSADIESPSKTVTCTSK